MKTQELREVFAWGIEIVHFLITYTSVPALNIYTEIMLVGTTV